MDSSRLRTGEIVAGIGGVALFVFLFFDWFSGAPQLSGNLVTGATISRPGISGWDALTDLPGFLIILSAVSGIALACLAAAGQRVNIPVQRGAVTTYLGALAVLLVLWRMFAGSPTLKIGVFLGLAAVVAITAGGVMALREHGYELLIRMPGGRTRAASRADAPTATQPAVPQAEAPAAAEPARSSGGSAKRKSASRSGGSRGGSRSSSSRSSGSRSKSSGSKSTTSKARSSSRSSGARSRSSSTRKRSSGGSK